MMRSRRDTDENHSTSNLAERLQQLEVLTGAFVRRRPEVEAIPERAPVVSLVPVPRRSRIFLRSGEGHGEFADLTLTAPVVRSYLT